MSGSATNAHREGKFIALRKSLAGKATATLLLGTAGVMVFAVVAPLRSVTGQVAVKGKILVWSAKILCQTEARPIDLQIEDQTGTEEAETDINLHNMIEEQVPFSYKAVAPRISGGATSCVSNRVNEVLAGNEARMLTCGDFQNLLLNAGCPAADEGFLVIESNPPEELQVAAVYTKRISQAALAVRAGIAAKKNVTIDGPTDSPPVSLPPESVTVQSLDGELSDPIPLPLDPVIYPGATGAGLGIGLGVGVGTGVGAGVSVDVEYLVPREVKIRRS